MDKTTAAIILAAGENQISNIPMIKKEITQLRKVGVSTIAVVTGYDGDAVEKELVRRKVISVRNRDFENSQMLDSVKLGIRAFGEAHDKVIVIPADIPSVTDETLETLVARDAMVAVPVYKGESGHPIVMDKAILPYILKYRGKGGLRAIIEEIGFEALEVDDPGILLEADSKNTYEQALAYETQQLMSMPVRPQVALSLTRKKAFLDLEIVEFLIAIDWLGSMNRACKEVKIAYSKAWTMINEAEKQIGYPLIGRQTGGVRGGSSHLTPEGKDLIEKYLRLKEEVERAAESAYKNIFSETP